MESEHPVVEINITLLLLRKFGNLIDKVVFQQHEKNTDNLISVFLWQLCFLHKLNIYKFTILM